ncbi:Rha family transcriptional regulator [Halomonas sp. BMC6]|uniref:Rha family transcriptional regulator n=1 Tax=Halomonas sp. BMC6 TaxID=3073244 RepID=UPI0030CD4672
MTAITSTHITSNPEDFIKSVQGALRTTSLKVAAAFGKNHRDVLRKIDKLDCSEKFTSAHFCAHEEVIQAGAVKRRSKVVEMDKDGFMFLVMGFTGQKAAQIKEAYINAFNWMAEKLARTVTPDERAGLRAAVTMLTTKRGLMHSAAYSLVHHRFNVEHIDELTPEQLPEAVEYIHRMTLEGEYLGKQALPAPTVESIDYPITRPWNEWQEHHLVGMDAMYYSDIRRLIKQLLEAARTGATLQVGSVAGIQEELKALTHLCQTRGIQKRKAEEKLAHIQNFVGSLAKTTGCLQSTLAR